MHTGINCATKPLYCVARKSHNSAYHSLLKPHFFEEGKWSSIAVQASIQMREVQCKLQMQRKQGSGRKWASGQGIVSKTRFSILLCWHSSVLWSMPNARFLRICLRTSIPQSDGFWFHIVADLLFPHHHEKTIPPHSAFGFRHRLDFQDFSLYSLIVRTRTHMYSHTPARAHVRSHKTKA